MRRTHGMPTEQMQRAHRWLGVNSPLRALTLLGLVVLLAACSHSAVSTASVATAASTARAAATATSTSETRPLGVATPASQAAATSPNQAVPVNSQVGVGATTTILNPGVVSWVHIGDVHATTADQQNYQDFQTIIAHVNQYVKNDVNFVFLAGDNANDGTESEYQLIKQATTQLQVPLYAVPGDHDLKGGDLYNRYLEPANYYSFSAGGYHFAFLSVMNGISSDEKSWLTSDLDAAKQAGLKSVLFMHSFTAASQLQDLIQHDDVIMVDSGHTHYNDVANDGHTIYAAGRNTGQVTEGPVGFDLITLDNGVVSWKFKPLGSWPFVMVTSPADKQLMIDGSQVAHGTTEIRAKVWDDQSVSEATYQIDGGAPVTMQRIGNTQMWSAPWNSTTVADGDHQVKVSVTDSAGHSSEDTITLTVSQSGSIQLPQRSFGPTGNDIGAYAEKGLLGNHAASAAGAPVSKNQGGNPACPPAGNAASGAAATPSATATGGSGAACASTAKGHGPATITGVNGNQITVQYRDGTTQTITISSSTQIIKQVSGTAADLKPGETIDVGGGAASNGQAPASITIRASSSNP